MHSSTVWDGDTVCICFSGVMASLTVWVLGDLPAATIFQSTSRSDTMPESLPALVTTARQPMCLALMRRMASSRGSPAAMVSTLFPLLRNRSPTVVLMMSFSGWMRRMRYPERHSSPRPRLPSTAIRRCGHLSPVSRALGLC